MTDQQSLFEPPEGPGPVVVEELTRSAQFSDDRRYRYELTRTWDPKLERVGFVMLNPSTADAEVDDPTIRRCVAFARRWGYGGIVVRNLFALRATLPTVLRTDPAPIGRFNDLYLRRCSAQAVTVAAWGRNGDLNGRDAQVVALLHRYGAPLYHLGLTKDGFPMHPLARGKHRIPDDTMPTRWEAFS